MNLLHVVPSLGLRHGGVPMSVREMCQGLAQAGDTVHLWATTRAYDPKVDAAADQQLRACGVMIRYFPVHPWPWLGQRYAYSPAMASALRTMVPCVDLVHIHALWLFPTVAAAHLCRKHLIPYVVSPCGALDPYGQRRYPLFKTVYGHCVERTTLMGAEAVHFTSAWEAEQARWFGPLRRRMVIPRAIVVDELPSPVPGSFRRAYPEVGQRPLLLFLGRLHPIKRLDLLAEAFQQVTRHHDAHLLLVGPDDGADAVIRTALQRDGLLTRATFTGPLGGATKWAALRESTLLLLPSEEESFGLAALEAMAVGIPIIVSPRVGLAKTIAQARAGMVVALDPREWAQAIKHLLDDHDLRRSMGEAGQRLAREQFSRERVVNQLQALYLEILQHFKSLPHDH